MNRAGLGVVGGFTWIPLAADCDLDQAIAVDVPRGDADVVAVAGTDGRVEVLGDFEAFPIAIAIPSDLVLIR